MHLDKQQSRKFYRLFNSLMNATNSVLEVSDELFNLETFEIDNEELFEVSNCLWENRSVIDDFIEGNPFDFDDDELEIIAGWKHALDGMFILYRHTEGYSIFIKDDHVFKVTGITQDIDELVPNTPIFVKTALLPFENSLTFAVNISAGNIFLGSNILEATDELYENALKNGEIISTPEAFVHASHSIREQEGLRAINETIEELEYHSSSEEEKLTEGFHRGVLADLTWEERRKAIDAHIKSEGSNFGQYRLEHFDHVASEGKPPKTLREALQRKTKAQISKLVSDWRIQGVSRLNKEALISLIIEVLPDVLEEYLLECQPRDFDTIQGLVDAGGVLTFTSENLRNSEIKAWVQEPFTLASKEGDIFTLVLPEEIRQLVTKLELEGIEKKRKQANIVRSYAATYTDLAGIVGLEELFQVYHEDFPEGVEQDEFVAILYGDISFDDVDYALWFHENSDYLIHFKLTNEYSLDASDPADEGEQSELIQGYRQYLQERHRMVPLRKLGKEEGVKEAFYVYDYGLNLPQTQALLSFIDAHIPDAESDYFFAERVYEQLLDMIQLDYNAVEMFEFLSGEGLSFDLYTSNELLGLLTNFCNHMPQWGNNGWSPTELLEKETGKKLFYHPDGSIMKVGRNDPCPCGSGKKYKKCCGAL